MSKAKKLISDAFTTRNSITVYQPSTFPKTSWLYTFPSADSNGLTTLKLEKKRPQLKPAIDIGTTNRDYWTLGRVPSLIVDNSDSSRLSRLIINQHTATAIIAITTKRDELSTIGEITHPSSVSSKVFTTPAVEILNLIKEEIIDDDNQSIVLPYIKLVIIYLMEDEVILIRYYDSNSPHRLAYEITVNSQTQEITFYKSDIEFPHHPPPKKNKELDIIVILDKPYQEPKPRETKATKAARKKLQAPKTDFGSNNQPVWYTRDHVSTGRSMKKGSAKPISHASSVAQRIKSYHMMFDTDSEDEGVLIVRKKRQTAKSGYQSRKITQRMRWRRFLDTDSDNDELPIVTGNQPSTSGVSLPTSTSHVITSVDGYKSIASLRPELKRQKPDNIPTSPDPSPDYNDYDDNHDNDDNQNGYSPELIPENPLPEKTVDNIPNTSITPSELQNSESSFVLRLESSGNSSSQETSESGSEVSGSTKYSYDRFHSQPTPIDCSDEESDDFSFQQAQSLNSCHNFPIFRRKK